MHALCQLIGQAGKTSMIYRGSADRLIDLLTHQGGERNLFYTVAHILPTSFPDKLGTPWKPQIKDFHYTEYLGFDLDGLESDQCHDAEFAVLEYFKPLCELGEVHFIWSGHGLHVIIRIPRQDSISFFRLQLDRYRHVCLRLQEILLKHRIIFKQVDPSIFEASRLLRVPGTVNAKEGKPPADCRYIESLGI